MDDTLYSFLSELRNEVKTLKSTLSKVTGGDEGVGSLGMQGGRQQTAANTQPSPYGNYPHPYGQMPNPYMMGGGGVYPFQAGMVQYAGGMNNVGHPFPQPPLNLELDRMNRLAEEIEKENSKFNIKSSESDDGIGRNMLGSRDRHTRAHSRLELKHEEELRAMQIEMEYLKHKRQLDELKLDIERACEKLRRACNILRTCVSTLR